MTTEDELRERIYEQAAYYAYYYDSGEGRFGRHAISFADMWGGIAREALGMQPLQTLLLVMNWNDWLPALENDYEAT